MLWYKVLLAVAGVGSISAPLAAEDLAAAHEASIASVEGQRYEMPAVHAFLGDGRVLRLCAPEGSDTPPAVKIYFTVGADQQLQSVRVEPDGEFARCYADNVGSPSFPPTPHGKPWVGLISLKLE